MLSFIKERKAVIKNIHQQGERNLMTVKKNVDVDKFFKGTRIEKILKLNLFSPCFIQAMFSLKIMISE